ncbi:MAG TPA: hypothetical protein VN999_11580, partial [Thermoanaerobaculia bacterium]|nr:hypothetical protein [Thermoanaerobaculia bacterium]
MPRRVAISGVGTVNAAGVGIEAAWQRLRGDPPRPRPFHGVGATAHLEFPVYQVAPYRLEDAGVPAACVRWVEREGLGEQRDLGHLLASV